MTHLIPKTSFTLNGPMLSSVHLLKKLMDAHQKNAEAISEIAKEINTQNWRLHGNLQLNKLLMVYCITSTAMNALLHLVKLKSKDFRYYKVLIVKILLHLQRM